MSCISITAEQLDLFIKLMVFGLACMAFIGCLAFNALQAGMDALENLFRKRGAATPFRDRAERAERHAERLARLFERIAERNRREASRRGEPA